MLEYKRCIKGNINIYLLADIVKYLLMSIWIYNGFNIDTTNNIYGFIILNIGVLTISSCVFRRITALDINVVSSIVSVVTAVALIFMLIYYHEKAHCLGTIYFVAFMLFVSFAIEIIVSKNMSVTEKTMLMIMGFVLGLTIIFAMINLGSFSPDSVSYYDISRTFYGEFGKVNSIRQYVIKTDYNISFPYMYPLCIHIVDRLTGLGIYSGVLFNIYVMLTTAIVLLKISKVFSGNLYVGSIAVILTVLNVSYWADLSEVRTIPLAFLTTIVCFALCSYVYINNVNSVIMIIVAGVGAGITVATRFDGIALLAYCAVAVFLMKKGSRIKYTLAYLAGAFLFVAPWVVYSFVHFGKIWISDNIGTAFLVKTVAPDHIFLPDVAVETVFNAPKTWIVELSRKAYSILCCMFSCSLGANIIVLFGFAIIAWMLISKKIVLQKNNRVCHTVLMIIFFFMCKTMMYILVGYSDIRYHMETVTIISVVILLLVEKLLEKNRKILYVAMIIPVVLLFNQFFDYTEKLNKAADNIPMKVVGETPWWIQNLDGELQRCIDDKDSEILLLGHGYVFGGFTDWKTYVAPSEITWQSVEYAMNNYMDIEYVVGDINYEKIPEDVFNNLYSLYEAEDLNGGYILFKVK